MWRPKSEFMTEPSSHHDSIQAQQTYQSETHDSGRHSPLKQLPALQQTRSPRSRGSISISQLLIDNVPSPASPKSALHSPSSIPPISRSSPRSTKYHSSPVQPRSKSVSSDSQYLHRFDRPPGRYGSSSFVVPSNQILPPEPRSCLYEDIDSSARTSHKSAASLFTAPSVSHDAYTASSNARLVRSVSKAIGLDYGLNIRQQPVAARACGFGERDRRVIDPPPIIELRITDKVTGQLEQDPYAMLAVHCTIRSHDGKDIESEVMSSQPDMAYAQRLMGSLVASPYEAKDEYDVSGTFFVFPDLSCRVPGKFRLHFKLLRVEPTNMLPGSVHGSVATIMTDLFEVHVAKDFPGMRASSALLRSLRVQGLNVGVKKGSKGRNGKSRGKREFTSDEDDVMSELDVDGKDAGVVDADLPTDSRRGSREQTMMDSHQAKKKKVGT